MYSIERQSTPKDEGFFMPAEWHKHDACWMAWPAHPMAWHGHHREAKHSIATLANTISEFEPVRMLVPWNAMDEAKRFCGCGVTLVPCSLNDAWTRDTCPTFLRNGKGALAGVNWQFNGWGDLDCVWDKDKDVAKQICKYMDIPCYDAPITNEGGAIHVDGEGTVLCTRSTVLDPSRNQGLTESNARDFLRDYLGAEKIIWLDKGYEQDETSGHIDVVACFVGPGRVMHLRTDNPDDPNHEIFEENIQILQNATDAQGRKLEVITVPQPSLWTEGSRRISCSYVNFYLANNAVFVPFFDEKRDEEALDVFRSVFPDREIVDMPEAAAIFYGGGGVHCVTQQQPARIFVDETNQPVPQK